MVMVTIHQAHQQSANPVHHQRAGKPCDRQTPKTQSNHVDDHFPVSMTLMGHLQHDSPEVNEH
jgi:hypothetical protein